MRRAGAAVTLAAALLWTSHAWAHSPMPGVEGFYVGLLHPLTVPGQTLVLLMVGLLLGFLGPAVARHGLVVFVALLAVGAGLGRWLAAEAVTGWLPLAVAVAIAALLVLPMRRAGALGAAALGGLVVGLGSLPEPGPAGAVAITVTGSLVGAPFLVLCAFGIADVARERLPVTWTVNIARVAGAWLVAIAALLLALEIRLE